MRCCICCFAFATVLGCSSNETVVQNPALIQGSSVAKYDQAEFDLKSNFCASDFKANLVGKWTSVYAYKSKRNIQYAEFKSDGTVSLVVIRNGRPEEFSGGYDVTFDRPPVSYAETSATITIKPEGSVPMVLSRVKFSLHNGVSIQLGPVLRIDEEPRGVLTKVN